MAARGSSKRQNLKHLAFRWALEQRFGLASVDVKIPQLGARVHVAACRPEQPRRLRGRLVFKPAATAVFECKLSRADFLKDALSGESVRERLDLLHQKRVLIEETLRRDYPTLREGETLFPEYDMYRYTDVGGEAYNALVSEMNALASQLHIRTKFARLMRWRAANVLYVVAEPGVAFSHELPAGWGLLERHEDGLRTVVRAVWQDAPEAQRWNLMMRIGLSASDAVLRQLEC
ncbi:MAG: hypothetical protein EBS01_06455 [Verrucomicrobia bacterium]|nr:hypothetical protein [Verrucomicrobiota bacterium]